MPYSFLIYGSLIFLFKFLWEPLVFEREKLSAFKLFWLEEAEFLNDGGGDTFTFNVQLRNSLYWWSAGLMLISDVSYLYVT